MCARLIGYKVLSLLEMPSSEADSMDQADVYVHITFIKKWDICAGAALLNALGNFTALIFNVWLSLSFQFYSDFPPGLSLPETLFGKQNSLTGLQRVLD